MNIGQIVSTILSPVAACALGLAIAWLRTKTEGRIQKKVGRISDALKSLARHAVNIVDQRFVDNAKKHNYWDKNNGTVDKEAYITNSNIALDMGVEIIKGSATKLLTRKIKKLYKEPEILYKYYIEFALKERKQHQTSISEKIILKPLQVLT